MAQLQSSELSDVTQLQSLELSDFYSAPRGQCFH